VKESDPEKLDLLAVGDEQLILLDRKAHYPGARDELMVRYLAWVRRVATIHSRSARLRRDLLPDAKQIGSMALLEALSKYRTEWAVEDQRCSFRTFLLLVFRNRFRDFLRNTLRAERRYERSIAAAQAVEDGSKAIQRKNGKAWPVVGHISDPALQVERREAMARLERAIETLSSTKHRIWTLLCAGANLNEVAGELGISYDATRRRLRKTVGLLKRQVEGRAKN
jgi:RNA polymerase sigma factor (sigma-70 family)